MPYFEVVAIEKFTVRTTYHVKAKTKEQAIARCKNGKEAYDEHEIVEGGEEWLDVESAEEEIRHSKKFM